MLLPQWKVFIWTALILVFNAFENSKGPYIKYDRNLGGRGVGELQSVYVTVMSRSMPIKSSGRIVPPGWAPLQPKQSVLSLIV